MAQAFPEHVLAATTANPIRSRAALIWASWFGAGYFPLAPGTFGTLAALPLGFATSHLPVPGQIAVTLLVIALAIPAAAEAGRLLGVVDAKQIVVDEVAGLLMTMLGISYSWPTAVAGFLLFRVFDILKPWPASYFDERVKNGAGVVLDDVCAGVFARLCMAALAWMYPATFAR